MMMNNKIRIIRMKRLRVVNISAFIILLLDYLISLDYKLIKKIAVDILRER